MSLLWGLFWLFFEKVIINFSDNIQEVLDTHCDLIKSKLVIFAHF